MIFSSLIKQELFYWLQDKCGVKIYDSPDEAVRRIIEYIDNKDNEKAKDEKEFR